MNTYRKNISYKGKVCIVGGKKAKIIEESLSSVMIAFAGKEKRTTQTIQKKNIVLLDQIKNPQKYTLSDSQKKLVDEISGMNAAICDGESLDGYNQRGTIAKKIDLADDQGIDTSILKHRLRMNVYVVELVRGDLLELIKIGAPQSQKDEQRELAEAHGVYIDDIVNRD